jgi:5-carboxymethyl-2-hydroxymuconate isomerase
MPHIRVEYSAELADAFDRAGFAKDAHATIVEVAGGRAAGCKSRFVRLDDTYIADGSPHYTMIHAEIALLAGRSAQTKRELSGQALALLRRHTAPAPQFEVQFSVDVRDLDTESYERHEELRTEAS